MGGLSPSLTVFLLMIGLAVGTAIAADIISGLVGYWPLDGDATDKSGNGNDGKLVGNPAWMAGRVGKAIELNGVDQHVDVPDFKLVTDTATFVAWINGWKVNEDRWTFTWQDFRIEVAGDTFDLYWNDELIQTYKHNALETGRIGLFGWVNGGSPVGPKGGGVVFDDFNAEGPGIPTSLAVEPNSKLTTAWGRVKSGY